MLIGPGRRVFAGRRIGQPDGWQMPQGGIDRGETPVEAACRELKEEVGTSRALLLRESATWMTYDLPAGIALRLWKNRWRGQAQKWFALAFVGSDADIEIETHGAEFDAWNWLAPGELVECIVAFKRPVYEAVFEEFADLL